MYEHYIRLEGSVCALSGSRGVLLSRACHARDGWSPLVKPESVTRLCLQNVFYLRVHESLDCKSPEPVCFGVEETLGMVLVPSTGLFPEKVL